MIDAIDRMQNCGNGLDSSVHNYHKTIQMKTHSCPNNPNDRRAGSANNDRAKQGAKGRQQGDYPQAQLRLSCKLDSAFGIRVHGCPC